MEIQIFYKVNVRKNDDNEYEKKEHISNIYLYK